MGAIGGSRIAAVEAFINGVSVIGSAITQGFQSTSINQPWTNFFIMSITLGEVFTLQFTGNSIAVTIQTAPAINGETPISASLTITRIV